METPGRRGRPRKSGVTPVKNEDSDATDPSVFDAVGDTLEVAAQEKVAKRMRKTCTDGSTPNGSIPNGAAQNGYVVDSRKKSKNPKVDYSPQFEFGGSLGVSLMMVGFPLLMYYMWIGATCYDGKLPLPADDESYGDFLKRMCHLTYTDAFPSLKAWTMYWVFSLFEALCYIFLPGIYIKGKPLPHEGGRQLTYYCSAVWSFWITIAVAAALHISGLFKLYEIIDEFGPLMSVSIISGFAVSFIAYASAIYRGAEHRMTGHLIYDFFMGAELNPRMFGILDFKMFFEVRLPWYILFLISLATAARQYENYGFVSGEVGFLVLAHFLYANACSKGEECIVPTWDIYYEKWGFMLIFWNMSGVPLSYCHCTIYLANHKPEDYHWNWLPLTVLYVAYLIVYWVWDTCNSQKNRFRARDNGHDLTRRTFPQLPWQVVESPNTITSEKGDTILVDGWCMWPSTLHHSFSANCCSRWVCEKDTLHL